MEAFSRRQDIFDESGWLLSPDRFEDISRPAPFNIAPVVAVGARSPSGSFSAVQPIPTKRLIVC